MMSLVFSSTVLLDVLMISLPFSRSLRFNICFVAVAYRDRLLRDRPCSTLELYPCSHVAFGSIPLVAWISSFEYTKVFLEKNFTSQNNERLEHQINLMHVEAYIAAVCRLDI